MLRWVWIKKKTCSNDLNFYTSIFIGQPEIKVQSVPTKEPAMAILMHMGQLCRSGRLENQHKHTMYWAFAVCVICLNVCCAEQLPGIYLKRSKDVYCNETVLRENTTDSEFLCATYCRDDAECVAYSRRGSQCVQHYNFCSSSDFLSEVGARYMGK